MKVKSASYSGSPFANKEQFIHLHNDEWLFYQRKAGKIVGGTLSLLEQEVKNGTTKTMVELDKLAETFIRDNGCIPTFLNYKGFPASVCISINKQLVHSIPTDYRLQDNDVVSFDLGATEPESGAIGDSALTCAFGEPKNSSHKLLLSATKEVLRRAIASIQVGKHIGVIGDTISRYAKECGLAVIDKYGGHGIEANVPHAHPFVANRASNESGVRFQAGMSLCIEPLFVIGRSAETRILSDGWTVVCDEICAHEEHTIFIHEDKVEVLTKREDENHF